MSLSVSLDKPEHLRIPRDRRISATKMSCKVVKKEKEVYQPEIMWHRADRTESSIASSRTDNSAVPVVFASLHEVFGDSEVYKYTKYTLRVERLESHQ